MKKKKILFLVTNTNIFTGFFRSEIKNISKFFDIYFLVSKYGFENTRFSKSKKIWFKELEKKKISKKIIWLDQVTYTNFFKNFIFNIRLINIFNEIKSLNIDVFLLPNRSSYWEEILYELFKKKKVFCYLTNPPSGLDRFNDFINFKKSLKSKKIYQSFFVKSDNTELHLKNTKSLNKNLFGFLFQKINIFLSKQISHFFLPLFLIKKRINLESIYYKLDLSFLNFNKIIIFNPEFKIFFKKIITNKNIKIYLLNKNVSKKYVKNYNWIFTYSSNDKYVLFKLFKYLLMLKKLKKLNYIYLKGHPTWKHNNIDKYFFKLLKKNGIKYRILNSHRNINYLKYYGLITAPSTVLLESVYNNINIKIIGIKKDKNITSGLLFKFYYANKNKIIWEPNIKKLNYYLLRKHETKIKTLNLKRFFTKIFA